MRSKRWLIGVAALLAVFGLGSVMAPGGRSWAKEKDPEEAPPKLNEAGQVVKDISTANDLIDYGRRNKDFKAMLVGIQMLNGLEEPADEELKVEGAGEDKVPTKKSQLREVLEEVVAAVKDTEGADTETMKKLIAETDDQLKSKGRGTATRGTHWEGIVLPTSARTDKPVTTISRKFLGKQIASVSVAKLYNKGVPLDVRILDPSGKQIHHNVGNSMRFDWYAPKTDTVYRIVIRNHHTVGVLTRVSTN